jgi:hypothetical protein
MANATGKKPRKARAKAPENETKADKFLRLGSARMEKTLSAISVIGNLASRSNYDYTEEQVAAMRKALTEAVEAAMSQFNPKAATASKKFSFGPIGGDGHGKEGE